MKFFAIAALVMSAEALRLRTADKADDMAEQAVEFLDTDGDNEVSLDELLDAVKKLHTKYCKSPSADPDYCTKEAAAQGKKMLTKMFNDTDKDGSGTCSAKEIAAAIRKHM